MQVLLSPKKISLRLMRFHSFDKECNMITAYNRYPFCEPYKDKCNAKFYNDDNIIAQQIVKNMR